MHTADRRPLVSDAALPGAALVLSREALEDWLADRLGTACTVQMRRLRYKRDTSVVLAFDLTTERDAVRRTEPCVARTYAVSAAVKLTKTVEAVPPGHRLAHDDRRHVLVTTAAGDRALPLLPRLARPGGAAHVQRRLLPDLPVDSQVRIRTLRHNPDRRWVGVLEPAAGEAVLLRAYPGPGAAVQAGKCYSTLARAGVSTPRLVARSRSLAVAAVSWTEGRDLRTIRDLDAWAAAGSELAGLHGSLVAKLPTTHDSDQAIAVSQACQQLAGLLPERAAEIRELAVGTERLLRTLDEDRVPLHGDFSADQVVVGADGRTTLIDLDSARFGASASDLGCLVASTMSTAEAVGDRARGEREVEALVAGYGSARRLPDPFAVAVHAVAFRLRKAADPFRDCDPDWRDQVSARVGAARAALADLPSAVTR